MQLQISWPPIAQTYPLDESLTLERAYCFCLQQGTLGNNCPEGGQGFLRFYWMKSEPVMEYHSNEYICSINGQRLQPGARTPLRYGTVIQAGHFCLKVIANDTGALPDEQNEWPELDSLLTHGGHFTPWQDTVMEGAQDDVLKRLSFEYKRFLLWGDQSREFLQQEDQQENLLPARDSFLDNVIETVKDKTMVECIFDEGSLIERVLEELMAFNQPEINEDEQPDLLTMLAPEHLARIERRTVSELLYRELYKLGLDSHL
ncbi:TagK domain-containing protein [Serratia sp. L9]|uniref:TagK domain-containing protein n=1 Tax=Serratia sp. L9 TaxID=3423946 RepID=UPI003D67B510